MPRSSDLVEGVLRRRLWCRTSRVRALPVLGRNRPADTLEVYPGRAVPITSTNSVDCSSSYPIVCGIAGYSIAPSSRVDRTRAAQVLLAAIAERGADAVGYAYRGAAVSPGLHKQRSGASQLLADVSVPAGASQLVLHVRDYTKGHPRIDANNHPVRHGTVVGVHNGIILNDEEIFAAHGFERAEPEMTVDSEAIFALAEASPGGADVLEELRGSMATAWLDDREPDVLYVARGVGRPLWLGTGEEGTLFASTEFALEMVENYLGLALDKNAVDEGTLIGLRAGRQVLAERFSPNRAFEERSLPAVRAPQERASCLRLIAAIVSSG
jgi:glutamine phosphoribosylpyrophosphate amidotransferase